MAESHDDAAVRIARRKKSGSVAKVGPALLLFLIVFAAYYFFHVQRKTSYFAARNLRILATLGTQIQDRLSMPRADFPDGVLWDEGTAAFPAGAPLESEIVDQILKQSFLNVFDSVLVVDGDGRVLWQCGRSTTHLTTLDGLLEVRGFGKEEARRFADISRSPQSLRVTMGGGEYRLFTQPMSVSVHGKTNQRQTKTWVVAGLVTGQRFVSDSVSISYTLLVIILAALLLALFSIPFLKLALLGELQRVRVSDILILAVSMFCGIAVVTIIFLDSLSYRRVRAIGDAQLRRLASDMKRHMRDEVDRAYQVLVTLEARLPPGTDPNNPPHPELRRLLPVRRYPFFESFARIDASGMQRQKWFLNGERTDPINVAHRDYFQQAMRGGGWAGDSSGRYVVESIRSMTNGLTQAVIAKRAHAGTESKDNAVVTLAFPMLSVIDPVVAGGCHFVVIDDEGHVVFHSESQRNQLENFFDETDRNKSLQSAVIGRQNEILNLRYWGDDLRAFATPIDGTPWTLVTFRSKRLLRTLNVETIIITLLFLMVYALGYALLASMVAAVLPSYRAPWIWPDRTRGYDYRRLVYAYFFFLVSFCASIYLLRPQPLLVVAFSLPAVAVLLSYLRLRRARGAVAGLAALLALAFVSIWFIAAAVGRVETDVVAPLSLIRFLILLTGTLGILAIVLPPLRIIGTKPGDPLRHLLMPGYSYATAASMLLIVMAILPTAALYKAAFKIEVESFVKLGQMTLVDDVEKHIDRLLKEDVGGRNRKPPYPSLGVYYSFFLNTQIDYAPTADDVDRELERQKHEILVRAGEREAVLTTLHVPWLARAPQLPDGRPADWMHVIAGGRSIGEPRRNPVPPFVKSLLPQYSDYSIRMRELLHSRSADRAWVWRRRGDNLDFESSSIRNLDLVTTSVVPRLLPRWTLQREEAPLPLQNVFARDLSDYRDVAVEPDALGRGVRIALIVFAFFAYFALLGWAIYFVTRNVFLVDLGEPLWLNPRIPLGPALGGNLLIFAKDIAAAVKRVDRAQFVVMRMSDFDVSDPERVWTSEMTRVDLEPPGKGILIPDFDHRSGSLAFSEIKLRLIESALGPHSRNVVAVTKVSPWVLLDLVAADPAIAARWSAVLATFTVRMDEEPAPEPPVPVAYTHEDAVIPTVKHMWRELKRKTRRILSRAQIHSLWEAIKSPRALLMTARTTLAIVRRPIDHAVRRLAFSELVNGSKEHAEALIVRETAAGGDFLRQLGVELQRYANGDPSMQYVLRGEGELYDEIGERASAYYTSLWNACSTDEKIVLMHIAADGFANAKDRRVVRRLLAQRLIRRTPNFRMMNETFRRFVLADVRRQEVARFGTEIPVSAWDQVRRPLGFTLAAAAIFVFATQRDLFDASIAIVTGLAGGIPALLRVVGFFVEPRAAMAAAASTN
jgi:hypothetical protein